MLVDTFGSVIRRISSQVEIYVVRLMIWVGSSRVEKLEVWTDSWSAALHVRFRDEEALEQTKLGSHDTDMRERLYCTVSTMRQRLRTRDE